VSPRSHISQCGLRRRANLSTSGRPGEKIDEASRAALVEAAEAFKRVLAEPQLEARWNEPSAIAGYPVSALTGHVTAELTHLESLLDRPAPADLKVIRLGRYHAGMRIDGPADAARPVHTAVRDMSIRAAEGGADATTATFHATLERLVKRLVVDDEDRLLDRRPLAPVAIRLADFMQTRVMELVVHADDLAVSLDAATPPLSADAAAMVIDVLVATARANHGDLAVIRALARRERASNDVFPVF
jgi:hypothetical protein